MILNENTNNFLNITLQVLLATTWIAIPITMMLVLMYLYKKYKKWEDKEVRQAERLIVKMNKDVVEASEAAKLLKETHQQLAVEVEELQQRKKELQIELGESTEVEEEQQQDDLSLLTIKELHVLAKDAGIRGYSRMKKTKLVELLNHHQRP